ncbi:MAG: hypothetical protein MUO82_01715, partial [Candidatus Thermoplasmatota archaeon]|nr:hypothetical protein [Candidatus Thermoplasmatota archaeon]
HSIPDSKIEYSDSILNCSSRAVKDVDIELTAIFGGTWIKVDVNVTNNEASTYDGTIRVYITEKVSSMGWNDLDGQPYTFPFLDWAFNEPISISAGDSWNNSMTWHDSTHSYTNITKENIMIIAAVSNNVKHKGYSLIIFHPFDAYYVDETVATEPKENNLQNNPPDKPTVTGEINGKIGVEYSYNAIATDPDGDQIYYWFDWGNNKNSGWVGPFASGEQCNAKYKWGTTGNYTIKVKVKDTNRFESDWAILEISMPKTKATNGSLFLQRLVQRFPFFEKILNQILL